MKGQAVQLKFDHLIYDIRSYNIPKGEMGWREDFEYICICGASLLSQLISYIFIRNWGTAGTHPRRIFVQIFDFHETFILCQQSLALSSFFGKVVGRHVHGNILYNSSALCKNVLSKIFCNII